MKTFFASLGGALIGAILGFLLLIFFSIGLIQLIVQGSMQEAENGGAGADVENIVLTLDLRDYYPDQAPTSGPEVLLGKPVGFTDLVTRLEAARRDDRVKGLFIRSSEFGIGSSRAEELRTAFLNFKAADKFILAHSQGTYGGGPSAYRVIAPADEIWVQPGSDMIASGIALETLFFKGMLDKLSIDPEFIALHEFKNAPNTFEEEDYTAPHREAMTRLVESIWTLTLQDIASDRGESVETIKSILEASPISASQMVEQKLADTLGWPEDAEKAAMDKAGKDPVMVSLADYTPPSAPFGAPVIAIVGGEGPIITDDAGGSLFEAGSGFASDTVAAAILEAGENEKVKAIVFRVDSPGGSPTASDQIWRAIERVQSEHEKPVIISMGSVAASGGYYVSTGADWIMASQTTLTGSIGIFGGKFAVSEGLARLGINASMIEIGGPFTGAFTSTDAFTPSQRTLMREWLSRGYDRFLELVAEGRQMSIEDADKVARGRVWSGADALEAGLVDEIGGINAAIEKAKALAEIDTDTEVRLLSYPMQSGAFPFLNSSASAQQLQALGTLSALLQDPELKAIMSEIQSTRSQPVQARMMAITER